MNALRALSVAAVVLSSGACVTAGGNNSTTSTNTKVDSNLITSREIDAIPNLRDALQAVQRIRPSWLTKAQSEGFTLSGTSMAGSAGSSSRGGLVLVYLDNARLGGLKSLADIPITIISNIQFMDPATATALLPGLSSYTIAGAIVVHSRAGR